MKVRIVDIRDLGEAKRRIAGVGAEPYSVPLMAAKAVQCSLLIEDIDNRAANFLKQDMLSLGGDVAVSREVGSLKRGRSDALVIGTYRQVSALAKKAADQPFGLREVSAGIKAAVKNRETAGFSLSLGGKKLPLGKAPVVMGVLNVTPDSFSDGGLYADPDSALDRALSMTQEGAAIIDIGGESSRPGASAVSAAEEIRRVVPVIKRVASRSKAVISIDTCKPEVARAALDNGAAIINDITGLRAKGGAMAGVAARFRAPVIIMHMRGRPSMMQRSPEYGDVVSEIADFFERRAAFAAGKGLPLTNIVLDPGIGFGKTLGHNLEILRRLREFRSFGMPVAVGVSRKSFIGAVTGEADPAERLGGSIAGLVWAALNGADIIRAHDVRESVEALKIIRRLQWDY